MERRRLVSDQIRQIENVRLEHLKKAPSDGPHAMVRLLARVIGVGIETADMLVQEVLSRNMRDRRAIARYAGLTGSPDESGTKRREKGLRGRSVAVGSDRCDAQAPRRRDQEGHHIIGKGRLVSRQRNGGIRQWAHWGCSHRKTMRESGSGMRPTCPFPTSPASWDAVWASSGKGYLPWSFAGTAPFTCPEVGTGSSQVPGYGF